MSTKAQLSDIEQNPCRDDFPLLAAHPEMVFLDSAATSQRPASVLDAQRAFYETMNANPLRGLYRLSIDATDAIERTRAHVARFIAAVDEGGNPQKEQIVFTRNTSESLNLVASSLGRTILSPGDEVVISIMEHHSNLIPWQQVCAATGARLVYLRLDDDFNISQDELEAKLGPRTKIVSLTQVSNVLGTQNDIAAVARRAHEMGAYLVVDGAQGAPHVRSSVREMGCDLYAFSAHKMMGPMGVGVLWGTAAVLELMAPFLTGGEMIDSVTETDAVWAPVPQKFEAGTQDAAGIYAFDAALSYLEGLGMEAVECRERELARYLTESLASLDFIDIIGTKDGSRHVGAVAFNVQGVHPHDVASLLDGSNVCIRAGHHCAQPLLAWLGVQMGSTCRASVALYNDRSDIDRLVESLKFVWGVFNG